MWSKEDLDQWIDTLAQVCREAREDPELVRTAPHTTPVKRVDEVGAARNLILRWKP
jgi:glycine dehydrogenase subunit 2